MNANTICLLLPSIATLAFSLNAHFASVPRNEVPDVLCFALWVWVEPTHVAHNATIILFPIVIAGLPLPRTCGLPRIDAERRRWNEKRRRREVDVAFDDLIGGGVSGGEDCASAGVSGRCLRHCR